MRQFARGFYNTITWQNVRNEIMKRDHYLCQDCLRKGLIVPAEEVHHIIPLTPENIKDEGISLGADNLISLCRNCHRDRHRELFEQNKRLGTRRKRRYKVDEWGRVTIKDSPL